MSADPVFPVGDPSYDAVYAQESAMIDASELIAGALERSGLSQADLARKLRVSRSEITARLKGERNITVRKLAETLHALDEKLIVGTAHNATSARARGAGWRLGDDVVRPSVSRGPWVRPEVHHAR